MYASQGHPTAKQGPMGGRATGQPLTVKLTDTAGEADEAAAPRRSSGTNCSSRGVATTTPGAVIDGTEAAWDPSAPSPWIMI